MKTPLKLLAALFCMGALSTLSSTVQEVTPPAKFLTFATNTGWCWYEDPRAIIHNGKLVTGGISGNGGGDVRVSVFDLKSETMDGETVLFEKFQQDDHDSPVFYVRPDGSLLTVYAKHGNDKIHRYHISDPKDYTKWGPRKEFHHTYPDERGVTYMNLYTSEEQGLLYCFFRDGQNFNPAFINSSDHGDTWGNYTHFITHNIGSRQRPYARYVQVDKNTIGISFTDAHPRQYGNSLYYTEFRNGSFYNVDGTKIKDLAEGPLVTSEAEKIYKGSEINEWKGGKHSVTNAAWTVAQASDSEGHPHIGYSVFHTNNDHHYRVASWDGKKWNDRQIAYGGTCLYVWESSYTGLFAFDPDNPERIYISTDANPSTGELTGGVHEIYAATIGPDDDVTTIKWEPITQNSKYKNIRPIVVSGGGYKAVMWLGGNRWNTFKKYQTDSIGLILERP